MTAQRSLGAEPSFIATPVRTLLRGTPVTMGPDTSIRDAAVLMRDFIRRRDDAMVLVVRRLDHAVAHGVGAAG